MKLVNILAATAMVMTLSAFAQTAPAPGTDLPAHPPAVAAPTTDGEVRKIDKAQGKVTLRHGPITNLDMPGMTMVFKVADPKLLDGIQEGAKVKFTAERVNGVITVTAIEAMN